MSWVHSEEDANKQLKEQNLDGGHTDAAGRRTPPVPLNCQL